MQITRNIALLLLRAYKLVISPWLPASCRYVPTCSEYAMEAIDRYGVWRGGWKALRRILRCHPFVEGGYDPVVYKSVADSRRNEEHSVALEVQQRECRAN
jgi:putative membrane protein insertion efficiency factor